MQDIQQSPTLIGNSIDKEEEQRKTFLTQEFQNFIKETLFDTKILDHLDSEFLVGVNDDVNPSYPSVILPIVRQLRTLSSELSQLIQHFTILSEKTEDYKHLRDLIEATAYEFGLREKERESLLDQLVERDQQQLQMINQLQKEQRKLIHDLQKFEKKTEIRNQRQTGQFKGNPQNFQQFNTNLILDDTSLYDWIVDIDSMTSIATHGWKVYLSPKFVNQFEGEEYVNESKKNIIKSGWDGATVAVTGLYDKGKTFVLNNLTLSNLPSGKKVNTKGISFKHVNVDNGTNLILVDTAGSYSPVIIENELSIVEKEATEMFILDLVFEIADYFICVVNDFTSLDQRYLDRLSRNLQNSPNKTFREIIVIHNLKDVEAPEILEHVWANQVTQIYQSGTLQRTMVAAVNPKTHSLQEKHVLWFKTQFTRHVCLVNDDSTLGMNINSWVFSLLRYWLKAVFVPVNRPFSVVESMLNYSKIKLSLYFRSKLTVILKDTDDPLIKVIKSDVQMRESMRIPQMSIDSSGLIMARPDSFLPATDIIAGEQYIIYMDAPGLKESDLDIYRQNIITIIKGFRKCPFQEIQKLEKNERKYGEFTLTFKIPEIYERKWSYFGVQDGVIIIKYDKDRDDQDDKKLQ